MMAMIMMATAVMATMTIAIAVMTTRKSQ